MIVSHKQKLPCHWGSLDYPIGQVVLWGDLHRLDRRIQLTDCGGKNFVLGTFPRSSISFCLYSAILSSVDLPVAPPRRLPPDVLKHSPSFLLQSYVI